MNLKSYKMKFKFSVKVSDLSVKLFISQCIYFATLNIIMTLRRTRIDVGGEKKRVAVKSVSTLRYMCSASVVSVMVVGTIPARTPCFPLIKTSSSSADGADNIADNTAADAAPSPAPPPADNRADGDNGDNGAADAEDDGGGRLTATRHTTPLPPPLPPSRPSPSPPRALLAVSAARCGGGGAAVADG